MKNAQGLKKTRILAASTLLLAVLTVPKMVSGQGSLLNKPVDSQQTSTIAERIEARKVDFKLDLSAPQTARIEAKCEDIQNQISQLKDKDAKTIDQSFETYDNIANQASTLTNRLKQQAISTATLQTVLNQYLESANSFLVNAEVYESALSDMQAMDCQADAVGFAVTLENARSSRAKLAEDSNTVVAKVSNLIFALQKTKEEFVEF